MTVIAYFHRASITGGDTCKACFRWHPPCAYLWTFLTPSTHLGHLGHHRHPQTNRVPTCPPFQSGHSTVTTIQSTPRQISAPFARSSNGRDVTGIQGRKPRLVVWLRTGVSSGNRPTNVIEKYRKCRGHR